VKTLQFRQINDVPTNLWEPLTQGKSRAFSREFWETIENSKLNDFDYQYIVLVDDNERPILITSFYTITTDIAIFAPKSLRMVLSKIRTFFPGFLKWKMIEWGTPITVSSPPFIAADGINIDMAICEIDKTLRHAARSQGCWLILVRDFESQATEDLTRLKKLGYEALPSLPNTYLDIRWKTIAEYHASLKSYYRSKLLKHLKRNRDAGIHHQRVIAFEELSDILCRQWMTVHNQADEFQREVLTTTFYQEFSQRLGNDSQAILFYRGDTLVGHALLLLDGKNLRWLYFGRNVAVNDGLYLYVAHAVIEAAIEIGAERLEMGLTTYAIKQDLGATPSAITLALCGVSPILAPFVGIGYRLMNKVPTLTTRQVFKANKT
jgi:hypothetical protein